MFHILGLGKTQSSHGVGHKKLNQIQGGEEDFPLLQLSVFAKTAGLRTKQGRNFKGPTACSLLSDRMSDKNIPSMLLLIEFVHNPNVT